MTAHQTLLVVSILFGAAIGHADSPFRRHHENGKLAAQGSRVDGKKDGRWKFFYANGKLKQQIDFRDGKRHGQHLLFYPSGLRQLSEAYQHGRRHGRLRLYNRQGRMTLEAHYTAGRPSGTWVWTYPHSGAVRSKRYHLGDKRPPGRQGGVAFRGRCKVTVYYDEAGHTPYWVDSVYMGKTVAGGKACKQIWSRHPDNRKVAR